MAENLEASGRLTPPPPPPPSDSEQEPEMSDSAARLLAFLQERDAAADAAAAGSGAGLLTQSELVAVQMREQQRPPLSTGRPPPASPALTASSSVSVSMPPSQSWTKQAPPIWRPAVDKIDRAQATGLVSASVAAEAVGVLQRGELSSVRPSGLAPLASCSCTCLALPVQCGSTAAAARWCLKPPVCSPHLVSLCCVLKRCVVLCCVMMGVWCGTQRVAAQLAVTVSSGEVQNRQEVAALVNDLRSEEHQGAQTSAAASTASQLARLGQIQTTHMPRGIPQPQPEPEPEPEPEQSGLPDWLLRAEAEARSRLPRSGGGSTAMFPRTGRVGGARGAVGGGGRAMDLEVLRLSPSTGGSPSPAFSISPDPSQGSRASGNGH